MTTLSGTSKATPTVPAAGSGVLASVGRVQVVMSCLLAVAFVSVFFRFVWRQLGPEGHSWSNTEDWGHAYIVPLISLFYVWKNRADLQREPRLTYWPGLPLMLMGVVTYQYFTTAFPNHMFQGFALIVALGGLLLFLLGPSMFPRLVFPLGSLGFAVTISEMVMLKVTWGLKLLASKGSWALLNVIGIDTDLHGNVLHVHHGGEVTPLNVADACAGMRMVVAFIALAVAVSFLSCKLWWQRVAILLMAIPVALVMNIIRVAVLGAATLVDSDLSVGGAHTMIGTLLLIPAFLVFMGGVWLVKQIEPEGEPGSSAPKKGNG